MSYYYFLLLLILICVTLSQADNCIRLKHHTFSWELFPDVKKVAFKAMFMPPDNFNDLVIKSTNGPTLLFRFGLYNDTISEWQIEDGKHKEIGEKYFIRTLVRYIDDPMPMIHAEWTRSWDNGFAPVIGDSNNVEMVFYESLDKEPSDLLNRNISWYKGINECGSSGDSHEMPMAFYWSWEVMMYFKGWNTSNFNNFLPAWIYTFAVSFILQVFLYIFGLNFGKKNKTFTVLILILKGISRVVITIFSILQMLLMMTYNVPLLIGIILGTLIGWIFSTFFLETIVHLIKDKTSSEDEKQPLLVNESNIEDCC